MARKQFILVAGVNYFDFSAKSYASYCLNRMRVLSRMHAGDPLRFIIFDFQGGTITTAGVGSPGN